MPTYAATEVVERAGIPPSTAWRRLVRLSTDGVVARYVRHGGPGGTSSTVVFDGPIEDLAERLRRRPRQPSGPHACPSCGQGLPFERTGPECPTCHRPTEDRGGRHLWCPECRTGYLHACRTAQRVRLNPPGETVAPNGEPHLR